MAYLWDGLFISLSFMPVVVGLSLMFGVLRIANLAYGEVFMLGGYVIWYITMVLGGNYWLAFLPSMALGIILAIIMERYVFRRYRAFLLPSLIVSIGLSMILTTSVMLGVDAMGQGIGFQAVTSPFTGRFKFLGVQITHERLFVAVVGLVSLLGLLAFLTKTRLGKAIRASAQDPEAAAVLGIDLNWNCVIAMIIAGALAAISGGILAPVYGVQPYGGFNFILMGFVVVTVGGMGSLQGAIIATFIIGFTDVFASRYLGASFRNITIFMLLIVILLVRPKGLFGYVLHVR